MVLHTIEKRPSFIFEILLYPPKSRCEVFAYRSENDRPLFLKLLYTFEVVRRINFGLSTPQNEHLLLININALLSCNIFLFSTLSQKRHYSHKRKVESH